MTDEAAPIDPGPQERVQRPMRRQTRTYATTNIVVFVDGDVYAEDFSVDSAAKVRHGRIDRFLDWRHVRHFANMHDFTEWLFEFGVVVDECHILGETLSDEERRP